MPEGVDAGNKTTLCSVIIPCRNESQFIGKCLDSILANDYPADKIEILVVDGMSGDGTKEIVQKYARRWPFIRILDNPMKITPAGLNIGIGNAKGAIILWMSAHNRYEENYISRSVKCLTEYAADNVGGIIISLPREKTIIGKAIVASLNHRFGVGNSYFRIHSNKPMWVDTVFGGCYRREVFDRIGMFNEHLVRGQDMEFNLRLKKAGGRTLLVPDIVSYYYARSEMKSFLEHNWSNGVWAILPFLYSTIMPVSWRHLVPLLFVTSLTGSAVLGLLATPFLWFCLAILGAYSCATLAASLEIAWRKRDLRYLVLMPLIFGMLHIGYGLGSLWGVMRLLGTPQFWKKLFESEVQRATATR